MNRTILIVDDSHLSRHMLRNVLQREYEVAEAENGQEALRVLSRSQTPISAVLLDVRMPVMDGFEVLRRMQADPLLSRIPVLVVTSNEDIESEISALSLGAIDFVAKPYNPVILSHRLRNAISLHETSALVNELQKDELTGLYNQKSFFSTAESMIQAQKPGYYVMACFDINRFKVINDQYGNEKGDEVLKRIARIFERGFNEIGGICARITADDFAVLYPTRYTDSDVVATIRTKVARPDPDLLPITFSVGRYVVNDLSLPVSGMYDRALLAQSEAKGLFVNNTITYDESMRQRLLREQQITSAMKHALETDQFEVWFQPQYNHATGALIGAEALVRWRRSEDGALVPPGDFIPVFERNGFIYEMDTYVWRKSCAYLRRWMDEGLSPLPVSVNVSRYDALQPNFIQTITGLVKSYHLPVDLLRVEITESSFVEDTDYIVNVVKSLIEYGFTVEIDDFGSGYSSLNTLKDVPAQILKLDMRFLESGEDEDRGGNVLESIVRMAKWLGMAVIAEGVEKIEQADYLKSIGCAYVQGYLYARPMTADDYEAHFRQAGKEEKLLALETVKNLDNNAFWNPESMDTLIFNSYVGSACIAECRNGRIEMVRVTDKFIRMLNSDSMTVEDALRLDWMRHFGEKSLARFRDAVALSIRTNDEVAFESTFRDLPGCPPMTYLRITLRVIATAGNHCLAYCTNENITKQREVEAKERRANEQLQAIMANIHGSVTAAVVRDGALHFLFANEQFYAMQGYTREQFEAEVGDTHSPIHPDDRARVMGVIQQASVNGKPFSAVYRITRRDGTVRWLQSNIAMIRLPDVDEPVQLSVSNDITEIREAEENVRRANAQLQAIMENIHGGVNVAMIVDGLPSLLFANEQFYQQRGYTKQQYEAEVSSAIERIHADDREKTRELFNRHDQPFSVVYRVIRRDGSLCWLQNNVSFVRLPGFDHPVHLSVSNDITELREAQRKEHETSGRLKAILDALNCGVSGVTLADGKLRYVFANDRYYAILGYTKEQFEAEVGNGLNLIHPEDRARIDAEHEALARTGKSTIFEYRVIRRDGKTRHLRVHGSMLTLEDVDTPVSLGVTDDVTDEVMARQQITQLSERLQAVLDNVDCGITAAEVRGEETRPLFTNDRFYQMLGYTREQYRAEVGSIFDLVHPEDRRYVIETLNGVNQSGQNAMMKYRAICRDGTERWLRTTITLRGLAGVGRRIQFAMFTDITEERLSHERERAANEQLRFLNETAGKLLAHSDLDAAINGVLRDLLDYFKGDRVYVIENDDMRRISVNTYEVCAPGVVSTQADLLNIPYETEAFWLRAFAESRFLYIPDVDSLDDSRAEERRLLQMQGIRSVIAVPLMRDGVLTGFVGVDDPREQLSNIEQLRAIGDYIVSLLAQRNLTARIESDRNALQSMMNDMPGGFARLRVLKGGGVATEYVNDHFCALRGMTREAIMSADHEDAMDTVHPDDQALVRKTVMDMAATGETRSIRYRLKHANGSYMPLSVFCRVTTDDEGVQHLNVYYADVGEQEKKETTIREALPFILSSILSSWTGLAFAKDQDFRYICASADFLRMTAFTKEADVVGKTDYDLFPKASADRFRREDKRMLETGQPLLDYLEAIPLPDGTIRHNRLSKYILRDAYGNVLGVYGIGRDVADLRGSEPPHRDASAALRTESQANQKR